jgi:hypothetical protein
MPGWTTGAETVRSLLEAGELQQVQATAEDAAALLAVSRNHLRSAEAIVSSDPEGAFAILYDAARKCLAAVLLVQGLRATSKGGHYAVQQAITAQFTKPPPRDAFRPFGRLRRTRNASEYGEYGNTEEDVTADLDSVQIMIEVADQMIPHLRVFGR